jgi:hypothetical protein
VTCSDSLGHIYKSDVGCPSRLRPQAVDGCSDTSQTSRLGLVAFDLPSLTRQTGIRPSRVDHDEGIDASGPAAGSLKVCVTIE